MGKLHAATWAFAFLWIVTLAAGSIMNAPHVVLTLYAGFGICIMMLYCAIIVFDMLLRVFTRHRDLVLLEEALDNRFE